MRSHTRDSCHLLLSDYVRRRAIHMHRCMLDCFGKLKVSTAAATVFLHVLNLVPDLSLMNESGGLIG